MIDQLVFIFQGFGLVMVVLALLWLLSALLGRLIAPRAAPATAAQPAASPSPVVDEGVPAAHVAAIVAAVGVITGDRARLVRVRAPAHGVPGWISSAHTAHIVGRRVRTDWRAASHAPLSSTRSSGKDGR